MTFGDWVLGHQLTIEARLQKLKLPSFFYNFLNIHKCFTERYPEQRLVTSLSGIIQGKASAHKLVLQLKERKQELQCLSEYQSLVRIINKLAKDSYRFQPPKRLRGPSVAHHPEGTASLPAPTTATATASTSASAGMVSNTIATTNTGTSMAIAMATGSGVAAAGEPSRSRSRERSVEFTWKKCHEAYVRLGNLPWDCSPGDICEFMHGIRLLPSVPPSLTCRTSNFLITFKDSS